MRELNILERAALKKFCESEGMNLLDLDDKIAAIRVSHHDQSAVGFILEVERGSTLRIFSDGRSFTGGRVGARINGGQSDIGFVFYINAGLLEAIEGFTYGGESWPTSIAGVETYLLEEPVT